MLNVFPNAYSNVNRLFQYDRSKNGQSIIDHRILNNQNESNESGTSNESNVSHTNNTNNYYRVHPYCKRDDELWGSMIKHVGCVSLPNRLLNQARHSEVAYKTGLLPEIDRIWVSIDNKLYLWKYNNENDIDNSECIYTMSEVITSVGLIKPTLGIFLDQVKYLMVLATAGEISILAVIYENNYLKLASTPYTVNVQDITVTKIAGTDQGRIFLGTADGNLCELKYDIKEERNWIPALSDVSNIFAKVNLGNDEPKPKFRKINHNGWSVVVKKLKETQNTITGFFSNSNKSDSIQTKPDANKLVDESISHLVVDNERNYLYIVSLNQLRVFSLGEDGMKTEPLCIHDHDIINKLIQKKLLNSGNIRDSKAHIPIKIVSLTPIKRLESENIHFMILLNTGLRIYLKLVPRISFSMPDWDIEIVYIVKPPPSSATHDCSKKNLTRVLHTPDKAFLPDTEIRYSSYFNGTLLASACKSINDKKLCLSLNSSENQLLGITADYEESHYYHENVCLMKLDNSTKAQFATEVQDIAEERLAEDGGYRELFYAEGDHFNELRDECIGDQRKFICLTLTDVHFFVKQRPVDVLHLILSSSHNHSKEHEIGMFFEHYGILNSCTICFALTYIYHQITPSAMSVALARGGEPTVDNRGQFRPSTLHDSLYLYASRLLTPIWYFEVEVLKEPYLSDKNFLTSVFAPLKSLCSVLEKKFSVLVDDDFVDSLDPRKREQSSIRELHHLLIRTLETIRLIEYFSYAEANGLISSNWARNIIDLKFCEWVTKTAVKDEIQKCVFTVIMQMTIGNTKSDSSPLKDGLVRSLNEHCPSYFTIGDLSLFKGLTEYKQCLESNSIFLNPELLRNFTESSKYWNGVDVENDSKLASLCKLLKDNRFGTTGLSSLIDLCIHAGLNFDHQNGTWTDIVTYNRLNNRDLRQEYKKACFQELWKHYDLQQPESNRHQFISQAIRNSKNDTIFQLVLCNYLYNNDIDQLLGFKENFSDPPKFIEEYLKDDDAKLDQLYRYYEKFHSKHLEAGLLMKNKGIDKNKNIIISKRIEYLEKSKTSYENASSTRLLKEVKYILALAELQKESYDIIHEYLVNYLENIVSNSVYQDIIAPEDSRRYDRLQLYLSEPDAKRRLSDAQRETIVNLVNLAARLNTALFDELSLFNDVTDNYKLIDTSLKILVHSKKLKSNRLDLISHYMKSYIYSLLPLNASTSSCNLFLATKRNDLCKGFTNSALSGIFENVDDWLNIFNEGMVSLGEKLVLLMEKDDEGNIVNLEIVNELERIVYVMIMELEEIFVTLINSNNNLFETIDIGWTGSLLREMQVPRIVIVTSFDRLLRDWTGQGLDKRAQVACSISNELKQWIEDAKHDSDGHLAHKEIEVSIANVKEILNSLSITIHSLATNSKINNSPYKEAILIADNHLSVVNEEVRKQYRY